MSDDLNYGISKENLLKNLPAVLDADESMKNLAIPAAKELADLPDYLSALYIYRNIDTMGEELLDILAYDFKVDWYNYEWTLEEKRRAIESTVAIHRKMGTVYSVKRALKIVATGDVDVEEWFDYDGEPYRFRVTIHEDDHENPADIYEVIRAIYIYKPVRAHLGALTMGKEPIDTNLYLGTALTMKISSVSIPEL